MRAAVAGARRMGALPARRRASAREATRNGVFISVDMEGMAGIVHLQQVMRGTSEFERSCRLMTAETNAAIAGARRAGVDRFVVNDSHGDMRNLVLEELDPGVEVISGFDKPFSMGAGLDATFEFAFFVGYHASAGTERAVMDHTYAGRMVSQVRINSQVQSEATLNAALAGNYGVRTALITGDQTAVAEAERELPRLLPGATCPDRAGSTGGVPVPTAMTLSEAIEHLLGRKALDRTQAREVMDQIMAGEATPVQIAGVVIALRAKGETVEEMAGFVDSMRAHATPLTLPVEAIDTCGTGGDRAGTFNISTAAALVAAGAGLPVAKHGNRAATSRCGSADVLEALGVDIMLGPEGVRSCVVEAGMGFCFAPTFHPAMRHAGPARRELGVRTGFNVLGPLANPAHVKRQALG